MRQGGFIMHAELSRRAFVLAALALSPVFLPRLHAAGAACGTNCAPADIEALAPAQCRGMAYIPEGEFTYGDDYSASGRQIPPAYSPRPVVRLRGEAFWLDKCEVTEAQYFAYYNTMTGKKYLLHRASREDFPATAGVSQKIAEAFCAYLGKRLPTDKEWEKAARGGTATIYPWGDEWPGEAAKFVQFTTEAGFSAVAGKRPNQYGLFDLLGHAAERTSSEEVVVSGNLLAPPSNPLMAYVYSPGYRHIRHKCPTPGWRCAKSAEKDRKQTGKLQ